MENKFEELYDQAVRELEDNDDLFVYCVEELDNWNGFADGFRCYDMGELDDLYGSMPLSVFLDKITKDFNVGDNYFYHSIYGIESCDYKDELYRDNVSESELIDNLISNYDNIDLAWKDADFDQLMQQIIEAKEGAA